MPDIFTTRSLRLAQRFLSWQRMAKRTHGNMEEEHMLANLAQVAQSVIEAHERERASDPKVARPGEKE